MYRCPAGFEVHPQLDFADKRSVSSGWSTISYKTMSVGYGQLSPPISTTVNCEELSRSSNLTFMSQIDSFVMAFPGLQYLMGSGSGRSSSRVPCGERV